MKNSGIILGMIEIIGLVAAVVLPFWNIPLIIRIQKRCSSDDISLYWAFGVWTCLLLMMPSGLISDDIVFKAFTIANLLIFSVVVFQIVRFRLPLLKRKE